MICNICSKEIDEKDIEKGNIPMRINNIPGMCHARCKADFDIQIVGTGKMSENLSNKIAEIRDQK